MNGTTARLGAALLLLAVSLGACVAETANEDEGTPAQTGVASSAQTYVLEIPKGPGGLKLAPGAEPTPPGAIPASAGPGAMQASDPEPAPWKPGDPTPSH
jgi:hypothetical protein